MSKSMLEEIREVMIEGFTDTLNLWVDLITAPLLAICRVTSDFIHGEGKYKHPDHGSRSAD